MSLNKTRKRAIARAKAREQPKIEIPPELNLTKEEVQEIISGVQKFASALVAGFAAFGKALNEVFRR